MEIIALALPLLLLCQLIGDSWELQADETRSQSLFLDETIGRRTEFSFQYTTLPIRKKSPLLRYYVFICFTHLVKYFVTQRNCLVYQHDQGSCNSLSMLTLFRSQ